MREAKNNMLGSQNVLLFIPNIIGYFRIFLLLCAWLSLPSHPWFFLTNYVVSIILDGIDGWTARKLHQESTFGAWLDVVIDIVGRQLIWNSIVGCRDFAWIVGCVEWLVFVCTHQLGPAWKSRGASEISPSAEPPAFVLKTMSNGFKTPLGCWTIAGLHVLPVWLYALQEKLVLQLMEQMAPSGSMELGQQIVLIVLVTGRCWCFIVEAWFIVQHIRWLLRYDVDSQRNQ